LFGRVNLGTVFGRQYQIANLAIGAGALVLGALVLKAGYAGYVVGLLMNAGSYVVHVLNVAGPVRRLAIRAGLAVDAGFGTPTPRMSSADGSGDDQQVVRPRPWQPYGDRRFLPIVLLQLVVVVFGYAQAESAAPLVFRAVGDVPLWGITLFAVTNCVVVVACQPRAIRVVERIGPERGMRGALLAWLLSTVPGFAMLVGGPQWLKLAEVVLFALLFAIGETLISPSMQPLAVSRAPDDRLGTYTSAVSMAYSLGLMIGPPLSLAAFAALGGTGYWALVLGGILVGIMAVRWTGARQSQHPVGVG
jgi:hypothetical protein